MILTSFRVAIAALALCALGLAPAFANAPASSAASTAKTAELPASQPALQATTNAAIPVHIDPASTGRSTTPAKDNPAPTDSWAIVNVLATIFGVVMAVIAAVIYAYQAYLMRQTLVSQNRAFVCVKSYSAERWSHNDTPDVILFWRIRPIYENSGNTPTRHMRNYVNGYYFADGVPENFDFPDLSTTPDIASVKMIAGPKQILTGQSHDFLVSELIEVQDGRGIALMWVWTEYRDVFSRKLRRTEFCVAVHPKMIPTSPECTFGFAFHEQGNNADQECERKPGLRAPVRQLPVPVPTT